MKTLIYVTLVLALSTLPAQAQRCWYGGTWPNCNTSGSGGSSSGGSYYPDPNDSLDRRYEQDRLRQERETGDYNYRHRSPTYRPQPYNEPDPSGLTAPRRSW